ncbi:MAG TPA: hypothetical protein VMU51_32890 [Mycobacteriales bacterium]|nr:hypothetical protein [Mycobacteriales bacterium]
MVAAVRPGRGVRVVADDNPLVLLGLRSLQAAPAGPPAVTRLPGPAPA